MSFKLTEEVESKHKLIPKRIDFGSTKNVPTNINVSANEDRSLSITENSDHRPAQVGENRSSSPQRPPISP